MICSSVLSEAPFVLGIQNSPQRLRAPGYLAVVDAYRRWQSEDFLVQEPEMAKAATRTREFC